MGATLLKDRLAINSTIIHPIYSMHISESAPSETSDVSPVNRPETAIAPALKPATLQEIQAALLNLKHQIPPIPELQQLQNWAEQLSWLEPFHHHSRLLIAAINSSDLTLQYANDYFCQRVGLSSEVLLGTNHPPIITTLLRQCLSETDYLAVQRLYHRHILHLVLRDIYQIDPRACRLLETPAMVALPNPAQADPYYIEFWLRSEQLQVSRIDPTVDEFAAWNLGNTAVEELEGKLTDRDQLGELEARLSLTNYRVTGLVLLEGLDVTVRETIRRITQLLIDQDSIFQPQKFHSVSLQLRSLFRTDTAMILMLEADQMRVFSGSSEQELEVTTYPMALLQDSHILRAIESNQVIVVRDLLLNCSSELGQQVLAQGIRSVLLIPLISQPSLTTPQTAKETNPSASNTLGQIVGLVALMSDRPNHFDALDCCHAEQLIPAFTHALTTAQRRLAQQRFITNIHPSVEWHFFQAAERRSLGLPIEPIVFNNVYPLYGISDIRGSSDARNRAIQADLVEQLQLGLAIVEAVCATEKSALGEQLRLDLLERIQQLQQKLTVDAEVTEIRYLQTHLEPYFDYFKQCGSAAIVALNAYQQACSNNNHCVYKARHAYDQAIGQINTLLKETWDRWQPRMQSITCHYCDIETTDGIDHMIYAGSAIDPKFGKFQLRSLRYEQLRAVCDCARTSLRFQTIHQTKMQITHLVLIQDSTVDIFHDESSERLFVVQGTRDTRYEIVKKRIDKSIDEQTKARITQPGMLALVYSTQEELEEYRQYLTYLRREGWIDSTLEQGTVEPLQGVTGLKFLRVRVLPDPPSTAQQKTESTV